MSSWVAPVLRKTGNILSLLAEAIERDDAGKAAEVDTVVGELQGYLIKADEPLSNRRASREDPLLLAGLARDEQFAREDRRLIVPAGAEEERAWLILVDLFYHEAIGRRVRVSEAAHASHTPPTTSLRYVALLTEMGLIERDRSPTDARTSFLRLSGKGRAAMEAYYTKLSRRRIASVRLSVPQSVFPFTEHTFGA